MMINNEIICMLRQDIALKGKVIDKYAAVMKAQQKALQGGRVLRRKNQAKCVAR